METKDMRALLVDGPAWIVAHGAGVIGWLWRAYWVVIAALSIACLLTATRPLLLWWLGVPLPLPPDPHAVAPSLPAVRQRVMAPPAPRPPQRASAGPVLGAAVPVHPPRPRAPSSR